MACRKRCTKVCVWETKPLRTLQEQKHLIFLLEDSGIPSQKEPQSRNGAQVAPVWSILLFLRAWGRGVMSTTKFFPAVIILNNAIVLPSLSMQTTVNKIHTGIFSCGLIKANSNFQINRFLSKITRIFTAFCNTLYNASSSVVSWFIFYRSPFGFHFCDVAFENTAGTPATSLLLSPAHLPQTDGFFRYAILDFPPLY